MSKKATKTPEELQTALQELIAQGKKEGMVRTVDLNAILEKMDLTPAEAISFGDQQNDIEMLEYTETSYAMAHAKPEIHKHATNVTESVEKTLRELLKTYF